jgi:hypothetical protein
VIGLLFDSTNKTGERVWIKFQAQLRSELPLGWGEMPVQGCIDVLFSFKEKAMLKPLFCAGETA